MKILLAVDGSSHAKFAEELLARFPFEAKPELLILSVCPVPDLHFLGHDVTSEVHQMVDQCRQQAQNWLQESTNRARAWAGSVRAELRDGHAGQAIVKIAEQEDVDLVVLGARGLGAAHRFLLGSVSDRVVKYAPCSVLVVHEGERGQVSPELKRILIADDGSLAASAAAARFAALPLGENCSVTLVELLETFKDYGLEVQLESSMQWKQLLDEKNERLASRARQFHAATSQVETLLLPSKNVADDILEIAREQATDLIVLGNTGRSQWERLLLGSVSTRIVHHAPCSVWVERLKSR